MIVLKFGGTSVRDAGMIRRALEIARSRLPESPLLVSSAMGGTTDELESVSQLAESGDRDAAFAILTRLREMHLREADDLLTGAVRSTTERTVGELMDELEGLVQGVYLIRECSPRSHDAILSFGERLSTLLIAAAASEGGIECELLDARQLLVTSSDFGGAIPNLHATRARTKTRVQPRPGFLYVTQGFLGANESGVTTTLGRGGSDYSATIFGAVLGAERVEIWTDVDGIMTSDPRMIERVSSLPAISYEEAAELAYFGARVVHPSTIVPAVEARIPVWVKNTAAPDRPGTRIHETGEASGGVRAIASKGGITLVTVHSSRMLNAYGFLNGLFAIFARHRIPVDLVATSEVSVSMTVDHPVGQGVVEELRELGEVRVESEKAIVCMVGRGSFQDSTLLSRIFAALESIPVRLISLGSSDVNLSLVIAETDRPRAVASLHRALLESGASGGGA